jgi:hypothetical protein
MAIDAEMVAAEGSGAADGNLQDRLIHFVDGARGAYSSPATVLRHRV